MLVKLVLMVYISLFLLQSSATNGTLKTLLY